jgi:hypothetical protein
VLYYSFGFTALEFFVALGIALGLIFRIVLFGFKRDFDLLAVAAGVESRECDRCFASTRLIENRFRDLTEDCGAAVRLGH